MDSQNPVRYGHLFIDENNDQYLFIRHLASGAEAHVQLVTKIGPQTGLFVRKVEITRLRSITQDSEQDCLRHIQSQIQQSMSRPNIVSLRSAQDIQGRPSQHGRIFHRVKYLDFYNCGDLNSILRYFQRAQRVVPRSLVRRCIWQVIHALHFMYSQCNPPVQHRDLHIGNSK